MIQDLLCAYKAAVLAHSLRPCATTQAALDKCLGQLCAVGMDNATADAIIADPRWMEGWL